MLSLIHKEADYDQNKLKAILMPEIVSLLHPDQSLIQFGQSEQFLTGLQKAVFVWRHKFNVTTSGLRRPNWAEGPEGIKEVIGRIGLTSVEC